MFDLNQSLKDFDDVIIERGKRYYHEGRVSDLQEVFSGEYQATVHGSEDYTVFVKLGHDNSYSFDCDCPYWNAPFCKHVVAVLFAIGATSAHPASKNPSPTNSEQLDVLLSELSKKTLISLLLDITSAFPLSKSWLKARISSPKDEIAVYRQMIRQVAGSYLHHHFIHYRDMSNALRGAKDAMAHLAEKIPSSDIMQTLDFGLMVIEETISIMNDGDDSDGKAGWIIASCLDNLERLFTQRVLQEDAGTQQQYYLRLMNTVQSPMLRGWSSWSEQLMEQCIRIADQLPSLREELLQYQLHKMAPIEDKEDYIGRFEQQRAQQTYFALLSRWGKEAAALAFASAHMDNDSFRVYFYKNHLQHKEFDKALDLCLQAEEASISSPGLYRQWQKRRYAVYGLTARQDEQKQLAEVLLLEGEGQFYSLLKELYDSDAWPPKRAELLDQLYHRQQYTYLDIITNEKDKQRLIAYARVNPTSIFDVYDHLLPDYASEIQNLFLSVIKLLASRAADRKAYQDVCSRIRIVGKACGNHTAIALIHELQQTYRRRPAFQDELQKILQHY